MQKLALGTVQFGLVYGIAGNKHIPDQNEVNAILHIAMGNGIELLDTARAYGDAEEKIGKFPAGRFRVVSKFGQVGNSENLEEQLQLTLKNLQSNSVYGFVAHNAAELISKPWLWQTLCRLKATGKIEKIGYSLYTPDQLETLLQSGSVPDLVQIPYSLFDRKFEPYFNQLKKRGTEIHIRSVFLQGLYLMDPMDLPEKLMSFADPLRKLHDSCLEHKLPIAATALNYVLDNPFIDQVVIGVDSKEQLLNNLQYAKLKPESDRLYEEVRQIEIPDPNLLNPANW